MRKAFNEYAYTSDCESETKGIFEKYMQEERDMQAQYDEETDHSKIKDKQMEWEKKVEDLLQEYPPE
jgi:hypothetical protein